MPTELTPRQKKAGVEAGEFGFDRGEIEEIVVHDFVQLGIALSRRAAPDREHSFDRGIEQAFTQDALPDHSGSAEQDDFHPLMNASRSALIVAASVVCMPCGKPL
jgi:hypothetical protein